VLAGQISCMHFACPAGEPYRDLRSEKCSRLVSACVMELVSGVVAHVVDDWSWQECLNSVYIVL
jgi:hypothetical protein